MEIRSADSAILTKQLIARSIVQSFARSFSRSRRRANRKGFDISLVCDTATRVATRVLVCCFSTVAMHEDCIAIRAHIFPLCLSSSLFAARTREWIIKRCLRKRRDSHRRQRRASSITKTRINTSASVFIALPRSNMPFDTINPREIATDATEKEDQPRRARLQDSRLRIFNDVFLECSRYNKHKSNTSNKRINGPSLLLSTKKKQKKTVKRSNGETKKKKEKRGIVTALPLPSSEEVFQCFARSQRQRSHFC